jgi:hypothetical protein
MKSNKDKKANFVKINFDIKDQPNVTFWVNLLTSLPFPLILVKLFAGLGADMATKYSDVTISKEDVLNILNACYGLDINVQTKDVDIDIKFY